MKKKSIVIGDIAKELNISTTTISFILNGKAKEKRISDEVTNKVLKYVKEVNYLPNYLAKSLRTGRTNLIGLIVQDISNLFFAAITRLIEEKADKRGFKILCCSSDNNTAKARELIKVFRDRQVDAYIITPSEGIEDDINALLQEKSRVVLFDRYFPALPANYVVVDNFNGTYNAIKHLIGQGYENIAFVTLKSEQTHMKDRLEGYKKAIEENGLKSYIEKLPYQVNSHDYAGYIKPFLQKEEAVDAVFFATNYLGISGLEAIRDLDKKIPSEIGVVSFDDHDLFRLYTPSVTVVAQPMEDIAEWLVNVLLDKIEEGANLSTDRKVTLPASLIVRDSSLRQKK